MKKKLKYYSVLLLTVISCTGCTKIKQEQPMQEKIQEIVEIKDNQISNQAYTLLTSQDAIDFIEEHADTPYISTDGFTPVVLQTQTQLYKIVVATQENEKFMYRNIEYSIPVISGNHWLQYEIPGACDDYMIFIYDLERN